MKILDKFIALLCLQKFFGQAKLAGQSTAGTRLLRDDYGATSTSLTFGQIVSMRKKNNRGKIIKRLKGTLGKRYHRGN